MLVAGTSHIVSFSTSIEFVTNSICLFKSKCFHLYFGASFIKLVVHVLKSLMVKFRLFLVVLRESKQNNDETHRSVVSWVYKVDVGKKRLRKTTH